MNESPPLKIDLRLALESLADLLAFASLGIATLQTTASVDSTALLIASFVVGGLWVVTRRLLGQKTNAILAGKEQENSGLIAENTVLAAKVTPTERKEAAEAGAALNPPKGLPAVVQ